MRVLEGVLLWISLAGYLVVFLVYLSAVVFKKEAHSVWAWRLCLFSFLALTGTIAVRWIESGHPPVLWRFEHALSGGWFVMAAFVLVAWRFAALRNLGIIVAPLTLLIVGNGLMGGGLELVPLPPPYQSNWLWIHVGFGWVCYGAYHVAAIAAVLYLLKSRAVRKGAEVSRFYAALPELDSLDDIIFKIIIYGFISHIVMLGSGAIWAYGLWGRYWAWDPIENWTLISWLIYGLNIHLRATYGLKGARGAWLAILSLIGVLIFFGGIGFTKGVHTPVL